jgi:hypothetical protein
MKEKVFEEKFHTNLRKSHTQKFEHNIFKKLKRNFWRKLSDTLEKKKLYRKMWITEIMNKSFWKKSITKLYMIQWVQHFYYH